MESAGYSFRQSTDPNCLSNEFTSNLPFYSLAYLLFLFPLRNLIRNILPVMPGTVGRLPVFALVYRAETGACPYKMYRKRGAYFLKNSDSIYPPLKALPSFPL
ncbi:MAG: hypothetical protein D3923_14510 [Candidatus Electrothrix sp. AR3]|nr:hypothetical protein [Candidatus Electrothrix sp. AR3]